MRPNIERSERIPVLREYYLTHAPLATRRELLPWKCHRSRLLYWEGWQKNVNAPTVRLRRSLAEKYLLEHIKPVIFPGDLIVGQPDYSPFTEEEEKKYNELFLLRDGLPEQKGRADHLALDYELFLSRGIENVLADLLEKQASLDLFDGTCTEDYEYYECCILELEGVLTLEKHYAETVRARADEASGAEKEELTNLASILDRVPAKPAETFYEALQSLQLYMYSLFGLYSMGRPDQYLLPYYRRDIAAGILTEERAQELIDCFCLQYIANMSPWAAAGFMLGGRDRDGNPVENELTWHFLASIAHTHAPDPNIGFCVTDETSPEILSFAAGLILAGHGQPQIWNSDAVTRSMMKNGYDERTARHFTHSTCTEITPIGASGVSITSPYINVLSIFLNALETCGDDVSFEELFDAFIEAFRADWKKDFLKENLFQLERGRNCTDPMRITPFIHDCLALRRSHDNGGARYNYLEPNLLGMTNTIESLNVIRTLVYERHLLTLSELRAALHDDYRSHEPLLAVIKNGVTHFGVGDAKVDALAKEVADRLLGVFAECRTVRGATVIPGAFSYLEHVNHGLETPASPDGRHAGDPLADGSGPVQGYDDKGPTLSLVSTTAWEPSRFLGGTAVNVKLGRNTPPEALTALVRGYLKTEGAQIQFTVVSPEELLDAKAHPENHRDLLVRIGGYSDFFVCLSEKMQDELISRAQQEV